MTRSLRMGAGALGAMIMTGGWFLGTSSPTASAVQ